MIFANRIHFLKMELKKRKKIKIKNIRLNIHQVPHHGNNYIRNTDHFVYKIKLADKILIHTGDARKYSFDWKSIDSVRKK